ncbi:hypothetical protein OIU78_021545, partial [Salix suchowensis]
MASKPSTNSFTLAIDLHSSMGC